MKLVNVADLGFFLVIVAVMGKIVMSVLERLFAQYGYPTFIRSDNGPEFIANALSAWLSTQGEQANLINRKPSGNTMFVLDV